ncbi:hypothetical protein [Micromonospora zhanjiangensis]|uniref:Uncharacterized protein n=1 Tax=Micromonospora zhanjiangensis TaxID=1522057 RepID=A0ABV8KNW0_9ACTN
MSIDADTLAGLTVPPVLTLAPPPVEPGQHRPGPDKLRDRTGRLIIALPVAPDWILSPAAYQLVSRTQAPVHADAGEHTGLLNIRDIQLTGAWTVPAPDRPAEDPDRTAVLAGLRAALADPEGAVTEIFREAAGPAPAPEATP